MKLIILDRDGVINHDRDDFVKTPDEWQPIAGSMDAIAFFNASRLHISGGNQPIRHWQKILYHANAE